MEADFLYLEDEVVKLRALEPEDLELLYTIENDTTLWQKGCTDVPYSRYALKQYIASQPADFYEQRQLRLLIVRKCDGKALGLIDLTSYEPRHARSRTWTRICATCSVSFGTLCGRNLSSSPTLRSCVSNAQ